MVNGAWGGLACSRPDSAFQARCLLARTDTKLGTVGYVLTVVNVGAPSCHLLFSLSLCRHESAGRTSDRGRH